VFKGGTCLKKVFFETYRFSEDLDFTLLVEDHIDEGFLLRTLRGVADWIYREAGIEFPLEEIRVRVFQNPRGRPAAEARVYYRGPLRPRGSLPRIKLDLTADERVVLDAARLPISHRIAIGRPVESRSTATRTQSSSPRRSERSVIGHGPATSTTS
jgi:hypothetical protein